MRHPVTLVVVGPITRDVTMRIDRIPADAGSVVAREMCAAAGGKGANPAVCAARLGARVRLVGRVGDEEAGAAVLSQLHGDGIDVSHVRRDPDAGTGHIVHLVESGGRRRFVESRGANDHVVIDRAALTGACADQSIALISTALPRPAVVDAVDCARAAGAVVVADLAGESDTSRAILQWAHIVRGDAEEIGALTGCGIGDFASAAVAARALREQGPRIVAVQAGDDGDLVLTDSQEIHLPYLPVTTVDPTGGGDALIATLAVLWGRGLDLRRSARLASSAAAHVVSHLGGRPRFGHEADLEALLRAA